MESYNDRLGVTIKDLKMNDTEEIIMDENSNGSNGLNGKTRKPRKRGNFANKYNYNCKDTPSSESSTNRCRFKRIKFIEREINSNLKT